MTATLRPPRRPAVNPPTFDLDAPASGTGKRRAPEVVAGLLVILVFSLGALWWQTSSTEQVEVLALRSAVLRGHVMTVEDLQVVGISSDDDLTVMAATDAATIIGRVARTDMAAGALIAAEQFSAGSLIEPGDGVVGLSLEAGQFPSMSLAPGDVVAVVLTPGTIDATATKSAAGNVLVDRALVVEVESVGVQGRLFVAVQVDENEAASIASAASANQVRLIQVAEG